MSENEFINRAGEADSVEGVVPAESFEVSDEEIEGFIERGGQAPTFHPILMIWREVLQPALAELDAKVTPQWASRMTSQYNEVNLADMVVFRDRYFGKIVELMNILEDEIETDDECLNYTSPEEDVEHNSQHYRNLLIAWQRRFVQWEMAWECTDPHAGVELAAISEVHKMFFGQTGLTGFLDNIKFVYTEADQAELAEALQAQKEGR